jgi:hypothetical protein
MPKDQKYIDGLQTLLPSLFRQITDIQAERRSTRGKAIKQEFDQLVSQMQEGDELWEWRWYGEDSRLNSYSFGWCVVRGGIVIDSFCHSYS